MKRKKTKLTRGEKEARATFEDARKRKKGKKNSNGIHGHKYDTADGAERLQNHQVILGFILKGDVCEA